LLQASDGAYLIACDSNSFGSGPWDYDFWLIKTETSKYGLVWVDSAPDRITLYRGTDDAHWNYVRVRIWKIKESP